MGDATRAPVVPVDMYASFTLPGHQTLPAIASHQAVRMQSAETSYQDWMYYRENNKSQHRKLNFDRVHWETQALMDGVLAGDKDGIDATKYRNPDHPSGTAWWWANKCQADRDVYNARLRHMKRIKPSLSAPLLRMHEMTGSMAPVRGGILPDPAYRRKARRAARKAEKQALWNEVWQLHGDPSEKKEFFDALWEEQKQFAQAESQS